MGWTQRIGNLFRRDRVDAEIDAELRSHIEMAVEDAMHAGVPEVEARRAARLRFGNPVIMKEKTMGSDAVLSLESLRRDVRYALRQLKKAPGFTAVVIVTLALGIGANTTVFSIVDAVLLRPLPYAHPEQLVEVQSLEGRDGFISGAVSYPDFFDWRAQNHSFSHLVSYQDNSGTLTGVERAVHLDGDTVSWDLLPLLGVAPELGNGFRPEDEKLGARVVLISHALWVSQFGSDPAVVGQTMHLSGQNYTIAGVMPLSFRFPVNAPKNDYWTTLAVDNDGTPRAATANRGNHSLNVIGRLKPGVTVAQADAEMRAIAARLEKQYPNTNTRHNSARVESELTALLGDTRTLLLVILGAVGLVLLIACGNVANLLLARAREREREMAMRSALGANRSRIVRQLLAESVVLGFFGGAAGCGLAFAATPAVLRLIGNSVPRAANAGVNLPVLAFALVVSLVAGVVFGLIPAVTSARSDLLSPLREGGRSHTGGHHRLGSLVIVGQVALGIVLTAGASLLMTSFIHLAQSSQGFNPDHVLTFLFETPDSRYAHTRPEFYRDYFQKLRALPGVQSASGSMMLPMTDNSAHVSFENPEHPLPQGQLESARLDVISSAYFQTMEIPLLTGRDFNDGDTVDSLQVMIVNQAFAEKFFPGENVLGKKLKPGAGNGSAGGTPWRTIVGVVGNIRNSATDREMEPMYFLTASQLPNWCCEYSVVRTGVDPLSLEAEVRSLVASMDRDIPVTDMLTMRDRIGLQLAQPRFAMVLLGAFAGLALLLTVVGLYGVMMYSVARRTREIGVRLALGAARGAVQAMVLRQALLLLGMGTAIGLGATLLLAPVLTSMLYGVSGRSPAVLLLVCGVVAIAGLLAAWLPARRASGIEPMEALRAD
ncbi:MAG TPA: ABC transporter permease [Acidobacteriaceae bacterium]|jgi:putative ABC transport system permease protein|nr:ABC transporter permease [Acidobacteriaceae bacterium]